MSIEKHSSFRFAAEGKAKGFGGFHIKTEESLPDTSRIPWFPSKLKTAMK